MSSLRSALARSTVIKRSYEYSRERLSEYYRMLKMGSGKMDRYREIANESTVTEEGNDAELVQNGFDPQPHPEADNPVLTYKDVDDCLAHFVADPFVIYEEGIYNMFFEIKSIGRKVFIGHAFSEDGVEYEYNKIVIDPETAQHTYPHIFKKDGRWLLLPSPGANVNGEFRVYEAVNFPTEWSLIAVPIEKGVRQDPTPILRDGVWYLIFQNMDDDVVLRYSASLTEDTWKEHPDSPIFKNDSEEIAKCSIGGAEMVPSGRPLYGEEGVEIFYRSHINREVYHYRITELTRETFVQERVSETPVFNKTMADDWNRRFMHTVNPVYPWRLTEDVIAVDGLESHQYRYSIGIYTT